MFRFYFIIAAVLAFQSAAAMSNEELAMALDTPAWEWASAEGSYGGVSLTENSAANGGFSVTFPAGAEISTSLAAGEGMIRIRFRDAKPSARWNDEWVEVVNVSGDPANAGTDWQTAALMVPAGGGTLAFVGSWHTEVDFIERVAAPASLEEVFGVANVRAGGPATWEVTAAPRLGRYVGSVTVREEADEGWFEFPVEGPAEVTVGYASPGWPAIEFLVDGKRIWDSGMGNGSEGVVKIEVPEGSRVLRIAGRMVASYPMDLTVRTIEIAPLPVEGKIGEALDVRVPAGSSGGWRRDTEISHDGVDSLRPVAPADPPYPSYVSEHFIRIPVTGPGFLSFMTWVEDSPEASYSSAIGWGSDVHPNAFRHHSDEEKGWRSERWWFPPGEHWMWWMVSGTAHDVSLAAIDEVSFEPSEVLTFHEVVGAEDVAWENDPVSPWTGVRKEEGEVPMIVSPTLGRDEASRLSATVRGPGEIRFRWRNGAEGSVGGELWVDGEPSGISLPWGNHDNEVNLAIPHDGEVKIEWIFDSLHPGNWVEMEQVVWTPWPEIPLEEALDASAGVKWETGPEIPFKGRQDAWARNGSAAQVELASGEEAWLEATVNGPGIFDFWLRDVPGAGNPARAVEWELFIDGVKSGIESWQMTWPPQWVLGEGEHKIRLRFHHPGDSDGPIFVGVDDVSWIPLFSDDPEGWMVSHPGEIHAYTNGGRENGPQVVLPVQTGEERWMEKAFTGPGVVEWSSQVVYGAYAESSQKVTLDGVCVLPLDATTYWRTYRLHLPAGTHTVRWSSEPRMTEDFSYPVRADSVWQVSGLVFQQQDSPLMMGIEDEERIWLEEGDEAGSFTLGDDFAEGDGWRLGEGARVYLCNVKEWGMFAEGRLLRRYGAEPAEWSVIRRWIGPGNAVEWAAAVSEGYGQAAPVCFIDAFAAVEVPVVPVGDALEFPGEVGGAGWTGLSSGGEAFDGSDTAWSQVTRFSQRNTVSITLQGPAKLRFHWKCAGRGKLGLLVDGAWMPVPAPGENWEEVEIEVSGESLVEWVHAAVGMTRVDAAGEAWVDAVMIEAVPARSMGEVAAGSAGWVFRSTPDASGEDRKWRSAGYRDGQGIWREGARGISGAESLRTMVTGPAVLAFRVMCAEVVVPDPPSEPISAKSVVSVMPGLRVRDRYLSVRVGDRELLRLSKEEAGGWKEHLVYVPAGQHEVTWRVGEMIDLGNFNSIPEWQAWVGGVTAVHPRDHYEAWADAAFLEDTAREPEGDADGDGVMNFLEYAFGTDPSDDRSKPPGMFCQPGARWMVGSDRLFTLHVPRFPANVQAVLMTSDDLETWTPTEVKLRGFIKRSGFSPVLDGDYDSGPYQIIEMRLSEGKNAKFFRIDLTTP